MEGAPRTASAAIIRHRPYPAEVNDLLSLKADRKGRRTYKRPGGCKEGKKKDKEKEERGLTRREEK